MARGQDISGEKNFELQDSKRFQTASTAWRKTATKSAEDATAALKRIGVLTPSGKLSSRYKG